MRLPLDDSVDGEMSLGSPWGGEINIELGFDLMDEHSFSQPPELIRRNADSHR